MAHRRHVVAEAGHAVAFGPRDGLGGLRVVLGNAGVQEAQQRNVQAVQPHHGCAALGGFGVAVVAPGPGRRDDEVARVHGGALAVDGRIGAASFHDEAQRGLRVAVAGRDLAGQDQLQAGIQALRDAGLSRQAGVLQDQDAAHGFFGSDQ
ncbi:hypothetical protein G6F61_014249 [Rhizopus arrhizus]|nr:hypothetical protein G6F61_014249 [Rhizopus arrhizus]